MLAALFVHTDKCREVGEITCKVQKIYFCNGMRDMGRIWRGGILTSGWVGSSGAAIQGRHRSAEGGSGSLEVETPKWRRFSKGPSGR